MISTLLSTSLASKHLTCSSCYKEKSKFSNRVDSRFEDAFHTIFNKINEIIKLIDPKKLIYLIFDGVPPRAKMDNQRGARFRYSENWNKLDQALSQDGLTSREKFLRKMMITPGTEFAYELDEQMKYFIKRKMAEDENWRKVKKIAFFIFSFRFTIQECSLQEKESIKHWNLLEKNH